MCNLVVPVLCELLLHPMSRPRRCTNLALAPHWERPHSRHSGYSGSVCANIKVACRPMRSCFGVMRSGLCSQGCQSHRSREPKTSLKCWTCVASSHIASMFILPGPRMLLISDLRIAVNDITFGGNVLETTFQAAHNYKTLSFHTTFAAAANARQQQLAWY